VRELDFVCYRGFLLPEGKILYTCLRELLVLQYCPFFSIEIRCCFLSFKILQMFTALLVCIYRQRRPRWEVSCAVALEPSVEFLPRPSLSKEASLRVNLHGLWSHARFRATNHDRHLKTWLWKISGPFCGKFCKENVWKSSEYVFIYFVRRSISRLFRGQLQCDD
jgi:hypothetical protein